MADSPILPGVQAWRDASGRPLPAEFFRFLRDLIGYIRQIDGNTLDLAGIEARLTALEESAGLSATISGPQSVSVFGTLADGVVQIVLDGDVDEPDPESYYGTDDQGALGYHPLPPAVPGFVPYFIPSGETFTVPLYSQALFTIPIDVEGILDVEGYLIEVD